MNPPEAPQQPKKIPILTPTEHMLVQNDKHHKANDANLRALIQGHSDLKQTIEQVGEAIVKAIGQLQAHISEITGNEPSEPDDDAEEEAEETPAEEATETKPDGDEGKL